jgi:hypothetical protein
VGFDRLVFRGTLRSIAHAAGMRHYLSANDILLKHFGAHVEQVSQRLKAASLAEVTAVGASTTQSAAHGRGVAPARCRSNRR